MLTFAVLQAVAGKFMRENIDLGVLAERIGRTLLGLFAGLMLSGIVLIAVAMSPLPAKYPYQRFEQANPDASKPNRVLLNADGFAAGWFSLMSRGSLSGSSNFSVIHPGFTDQLFLNRNNIADGVSVITGPDAIEAPVKDAVWPAPDGLKDSDGKELQLKSGFNLMIVRLGITTRILVTGGTFTFSQLRVVCQPKADNRNITSGSGINIYPAGYVKTPGRIQLKRLDEQVKLERSDVSGRVKWIDFVFYVPDGFVPVLAEFKQNAIAQLPAPISIELAPQPESFIQSSRCATETAELKTVRSATLYGIELAAGVPAGLKLQISDANQFQTLQTPGSILPAQFSDGKIVLARAELNIAGVIEEQPSQNVEVKDSNNVVNTPTEKKKFKPITKVAKAEGLAALLATAEGYSLISLKCNNPSVGSVIKGEQLPSLVEVSGRIHRPAGIIAAGTAGNQTICQFDYCCLPASSAGTAGGLVIAEDGTITKSFVDTVWLTERVQSVTEFYLLFLVRSGRNAIITTVAPSDSQPAAGFNGYEGFLVR